MADFEEVLKGSLILPHFSAAARLSVLHESLPRLLMMIGASAVNDDAYTALDLITHPEGRIEGTRSSQVPDPDPESEEPLQTEYIRPNGETYYSREWSGYQDVEVLLRARTHSQYPLLYGPPGTGKTALIEAAFPTDLITIVMTGDTSERDLVGQFIPNPDFGKEDQPEYLWSDGPLTTAMKEGRPLLIDEIGLGDTKVLSILYGTMDGRRELVIASNPGLGVIRAAEGFFVIGATNPNAPGVTLSEALLSRFTLHVEVTTDWNLAVSMLKVPDAIAGMAHSLSKQQAAGAINWAPQMRELLAFRDLSNIFGETFALANLIAVCPAEDREHVQERIGRIYGGTAVSARI